MSIKVDRLHSWNCCKRNALTSPYTFRCDTCRQIETGERCTDKKDKYRARAPDAVQHELSSFDSFTHSKHMHHRMVPVRLTVLHNAEGTSGCHCNARVHHRSFHFFQADDTTTSTQVRRAQQLYKLYSGLLVIESRRKAS